MSNRFAKHSNSNTPSIGNKPLFRRRLNKQREKNRRPREVSPPVFSSFASDYRPNGDDESHNYVPKTPTMEQFMLSDEEALYPSSTPTIAPVSNKSRTKPSPFSGPSDFRKQEGQDIKVTHWGGRREEEECDNLYSSEEECPNDDNDLEFNEYEERIDNSRCGIEVVRGKYRGMTGTISWDYWIAGGQGSWPGRVYIFQHDGEGRRAVARSDIGITMKSYPDNVARDSSSDFHTGEDRCKNCGEPVIKKNYTYFGLDGITNDRAYFYSTPNRSLNLEGFTVSCELSEYKNRLCSKICIVCIKTLAMGHLAGVRRRNF
jgi:hypothetical protein